MKFGRLNKNKKLKRKYLKVSKAITYKKVN